MKKLFNKISLFVIILLAFYILIPFTNAINDYRIEITGSSNVHEYGAWQIFKGSVGSDGALSNIEWGSGIQDKNALINELKQDSILKSYFGSVENAYDVAAALSNIEAGDDSKEVKQFAEIVSKHIQTETPQKSTFIDNKHVINNLEAGYYFIKDIGGSAIGDAVTRYILKVTTNTSINVKADAPTVKKQVSHYDLSDFHDAISAETESTVTFKLTGTLPDNYADYKKYYYHFIDTLPNGLKYKEGTLKVTIGGQNATDNFNITNSSTLDIIINDLAALNPTFNINANTEIVVTYDAIVDKEAILGLKGNSNSVELEYSSNPNSAGVNEKQKTVKDTATVYVYQLEINKINSKNNNPLSGVKFRLYKYDNGQKKYAKLDDGKIVSWVSENDIVSSTEVETQDGKIIIAGLEAGTYYLTESYSLPGYDSIEDIKLIIEEELSDDNNLIQELKKLSIAIDDGEKINGDINLGKVSITIKNVPGLLLPSTGGVGVIIIYAIGISLLILSLVLIIWKKHNKCR